jgi:hypothetical protein
MDLQSAIVNWLRKNNQKTSGQIDSAASAAKSTAERIAAKIPEPLMPQEGLREKKRRMDSMDSQTRDE